MSILSAKTKQNQIILISDIENKEEVFCVDCNTSLIAKRGKVRGHHFS
jgi:competence CoiA-like predicted nuclease